MLNKFVLGSVAVFGGTCLLAVKITLRSELGALGKNMKEHNSVMEDKLDRISINLQILREILQNGAK